MKIFKYTCIALLAACILVMGGCKEEDEGEPIETALVGTWSNEDDSNPKTFTISSDGSFLVTMNPYGIQGEGKVKGILVKEGNEYKMNKMKETTGVPAWGDAVGLYNGEYVQITFSNNDTFELKSADNNAVEEYFGGIYYRQ